MLYICTLNELKDDLGLTDVADDHVLAPWLEGLQGRFDGHCRRRFLYREGETEFFDGGRPTLYVARWPIASVSEIIIDSDQAWNPLTALETDEYRVNHQRGRILYGTSGAAWPAAPQSIRVIYSGGFVKSDGTAAAYVDAYDLTQLKRAFRMQAGYEWRNRETLGITQLTQAGVSKAAGDSVLLALREMTLLPEVQSTLTPFVRVSA